MTEILQEFNTKGFQEQLVNWFEEHKRDLPWRKTRDPYRIWVSEIMLQQTRVDTVIPYYNNFIQKFPTLQDLAFAEEQEILKAWEGLGYYSRVRNLQAAVREVAEEYGGKVPDTKEKISQLKGVGPYTAGAVLSIAYNKPEPAVDGNVMRVISRVLLIEEDIGKVKTRTIFERALSKMISKQKPSEFNQGLMELGALVCTPKSPGCLLCPVREYCRAYHAGKEKSLPIKEKKTKVKAKDMAAIVLRNNTGEVLIERRPETGLLAKLWQFPNIETIKDAKQQHESLREYLKTEYAMTVEVGEIVQKVKHVFSHLIWSISVYEGTILSEKPIDNDNIRWVNENSIESFPFPVSHQKIIAQQIRR
ncbi:A/G-specific adenine glycosylase [Alkalihalobacterium alkalinitrilicum]|uniref:A/G-specific adenine glycosylase n=1 Tax=Alkalihalobacterium alkalinitrilicum TaxID=427920 RepID=UPI000995CE70|nr:A/G-specific adenine glycosylase [Alkalihalobacterium alkalinitrilicum]